MAKKKTKAQIVWNTAYDVLKWITLILFPASITLVSVIMQTTGQPNVEIVITILTAINAFLGTILGISNITYQTSQKIENMAK